MIVIDTTVAISIIHQKISNLQFKKIITTEENIVITAPSMYEIYYGLFKLKRKKGQNINEKKWNQELVSIQKLSKVLSVLPYTLESARISADIYTELVSKGISIDLFDCFIAGTALSHNYNRILTENVKHFERIPNFNCIEFPLKD